MHTVYIHCGLHKTGTTAIQRAFTAHQNILRVNRLLYPRPDSLEGHHNLAWELTEDRRFDKTGTTWKIILEDIAGFEGDVLLSSEDFESILHRPNLLSQITEAIRAVGREVCVIIYIRERNQYIESLYLELLRHGYAASFGAYLREIRQTGFLRYREWVYQFDMARICAVLGAVPGLRFVRRDYRESYGDSTAMDLLGVLGLSPHILGKSDLSRVNQRHATAISVSQFLFNKAGRPLTPQESTIIAKLCPRKLVKWSTGSPDQPEHEAGATAPHYLGRVFSNRTVERIQHLASPAGAHDLETRLQQLAAWWQGGAAAMEAYVAFQYAATLANLPSFRMLRGNAGDPEDPLWRRRVAALVRSG